MMVEGDFVGGGSVSLMSMSLVGAEEYEGMNRCG